MDRFKAHRFHSTWTASRKACRWQRSAVRASSEARSKAVGKPRCDRLQWSQSILERGQRPESPSEIILERGFSMDFAMVFRCRGQISDLKVDFRGGQGSLPT